MKRLAQRGAALLAAMLTVALVATFAAAAVWQQWRAVEVESAERWRTQSAWLLTGALDWARLVLREDARAARDVDHLAEPWAVPLQEARLSTFLAADQNNNVASDDADGNNVFLAGQITDLQAMLNVNTLTAAGKPTPPEWLRAFDRLFQMLGIPQSELVRLAENLRFANDISTDNRSSARAPLAPQRLEQLVWLGLSPQAVQALAPYVTVLPTTTKVNLNTASAEVIFAVAEGMSLAQAQQLVAARDRQHFKSVADAAKVVGGDEKMLSGALFAVNSNFFEIRGRLRSDDVVIEQRSVVQRNGLEIRTVQREQGVFEPLPSQTVQR